MLNLKLVFFFLVGPKNTQLQARQSDEARNATFFLMSCASNDLKASRVVMNLFGVISFVKDFWIFYSYTVL